MGFVHFANGCIMGPFLEYVDYKNWVELKDHYAKMPTGDFTTVVPAMKRLGTGIVVMLFHMFLTLYLGFSIYFCGSLEYRTYKTFLHRCGFFLVAMTSQRFMYYTPWCFTDAGLIACGLAYGETDK